VAPPLSLLLALSEVLLLLLLLASHAPDSTEFSYSSSIDAAAWVFSSFLLIAVLGEGNPCCYADAAPHF
jgi:hypothetical protein